MSTTTFTLDREAVVRRFDRIRERSTQLFEMVDMRRVGTVHVDLGPAPQAGLFVASPQAVEGRGTTASVSTATSA